MYFGENVRSDTSLDLVLLYASRRVVWYPVYAALVSESKSITHSSIQEQAISMAKPFSVMDEKQGKPCEKMDAGLVT